MLNRVPLLVWFIIPTVIILGVGVWFFSKSPSTKVDDETKPASVSQPVEGTVDHVIEGRNHTAQGITQFYNTNPPSSGPHWPNPAKNGIYDNPLPDEQIVHNLEHGYVWISYKPDAGDEVINKLKEIVKKDDWKVILEPREKNEQTIALAAWGRTLNLAELDEQKVEDFIRTYRNRGPEKTPE